MKSVEVYKGISFNARRSKITAYGGRDSISIKKKNYNNIFNFTKQLSLKF